MLSITVTGNGLRVFGKQVERLHKEFPKVLPRIINQTGDRSKTQVIRSLTAQTGLQRKVIVSAIGDPFRAHAGNLSYTMTTRGGNVRLKYLQPRETAKGVTAKPFGKRQLFKRHFLTAGWRPNRIEMAKWGGHVKRATGPNDEFAVTARSGVFIPKEMVEGATKSAFEATAAKVLKPRVDAAIAKLLR